MDKISSLHKDVVNLLDANKALDIVSIDLDGKSSIADQMIIASGTSSRHIQALSEQVYEYLKKNNKNTDIYFIMGADSLINFHKWKNSDLISSICKILVFDRDRYKAKSLSSRSFKKYSKKSLKFIKFNKVNISSSKLRKI